MLTPARAAMCEVGGGHRAPPRRTAGPSPGPPDQRPDAPPLRSPRRCRAGPRRPSRRRAPGKSGTGNQGVAGTDGWPPWRPRVDPAGVRAVRVCRPVLARRDRARRAPRLEQHPGGSAGAVDNHLERGAGGDRLDHMAGDQGFGLVEVRGDQVGACGQRGGQRVRAPSTTLTTPCEPATATSRRTRPPAAPGAGSRSRRGHGARRRAGADGLSSRSRSWEPGSGLARQHRGAAAVSTTMVACARRRRSARHRRQTLAVQQRLEPVRPTGGQQADQRAGHAEARRARTTLTPLPPAVTATRRGRETVPTVSSATHRVRTKHRFGLTTSAVRSVPEG